ncbi:lysis protein [Caulobacter phage Jess A]|nr:lysis protein [Caulobacter phage Jess A]WCA46448.1 lysis protein [Caulobacter phage RapA]
MADNISLGVADYLASKDAPLGPKLKDSLLYGVQQQPDMQARMRRYARDLNVPLPAALEDHQYVGQVGAVQDLDPNGMVLGSPKTATWLAEPDNAAVAHDDVPILQQVENGVRHLGQLGKASALGFFSGGLGYLQAASPFLRQLGIKDPSGMGYFDDENSQMGQFITTMRKATKTASDAAMPKTDNPWAAGVDSGVVSLVQNAPILAAAVATKNPMLALGGAGALTGGQAYGDARDAGLSPTRSRVYAGIQGGIEVATEKLPIEALVGDVVKHSGLAQTIMHQLITEVPGEQVATAAQDFTEWAMIHPDRPFSEYLASRPDAALSTLVATGVGVAGNVSLSRTTDAIASNMQRDQPQAVQAAQAEASNRVLDNLMKVAEASKLRERDPQTFEQFVASATEGSPVDSVYVPAQVLVDQLAGGSPEQLAQNAAVLQAMPSVASQLDAAVTSGGLVEIPVSEFAAYAAGTPLAQSLLPHLKTDPNGFSMDEANTFMQAQAENFKAEVASTLQNREVVDAFEQSAEAVRTTVKGLLQTANRYTADVNEAYAAMVSSFYATQAARLNVTPQELFDRYPLNVQAAGVLDNSLTQGEASPKAVTETPEFKAWFGASAITDDSGAPKVMYHGTRSDFSAFGKIDGGNAFGDGYYFTDNPAVASNYATGENVNRITLPGDAGPNVMPVYLKAEKPLNLADRNSLLPQDVLADLEKEANKQQPKTFKKGELAKSFDRAYKATAGNVRQWLGENGIDADAAFKALGYDALITEMGTVVFSPTQIKSVFNGGAFDPNNPDLLAQGEQGPLGTYHPQTATITLLKGANLSTFLHEAGHHYLEMLATFAAMPDAPQEVKDDWAAASRFIGAEGSEPQAWLDTPLEKRREGHETWARAFEAYLREGKAPSQKLTGVFQRFKAWLIQVYQSAKQLNVELSDEVRGVFDRLLASATDIANMERARQFTPVFDTKPDSMTDQEWEAYQRLNAQATADAQDELAARSIRDMRWLSNQKARIVAELTKSAAETRKAVRAEVTQELMAQPVNAAREFLKRGTISGEPWEGPHKLDKDAVAAIYEGTPKEAQDWAKLGYGKYGMLAADGLDPNMVAELFGFSSGDELVESLLNAPDFKAEVEGLTDQRMLERYGDLTDPDAINRAADEAIHNDARLRFVATEANALAKATGRTKILAEAARNYASELISRQRIRDLKPAKYTGAEARASRQAAQAAAKGDLVTAAQEKRNQLINGYAAQAVFAAQADVDKALRLFARLDSAATRRNMDPEYRDQIDAMLERFDLRKSETLKDIDKRTSLKAWIENQRAKGLDPIISEELENEANRKHFRDMTVDELRGLVDAVRNIAHLGRLKHRLLVAADKREFEATVRDVADEIRDNAYRTVPPKLENNTWQDRALAGFANYLAIHRKLASIVREMAGLKDGTLIWKAFVQPMNEANDREATMREAATIQLNEIFAPLIKAGGLRNKLFIPEIGTSLTLEGRLAVALNWGNELNRARIMDGDRWTAPQVNAILTTLTPDQLEFVNRLWAYLDSYWPEIAAKEKRVTGVTPEKVEAEPFQVTASDGSVVDMRGGYYPIKYDTERSSRSEGDEIAEAVRATMQGAYTRATTRRGHTKARVDKVERPVRKDLSVPFQHVNQVVHDLAFHEYLIDANRLLGASDIDQAIRDHYGVETLRTMRNTLKAIAEGEIPAENALEKAVNYIRTGSTVAGLGWNLMTSLLQPLGLTQSIVRIGPKWVAKGLGRAFSDAATLQNTVQMINDKSDFMRLRSKTFLREINEVSNQVRDSWKASAWGPVEQSFFWMIGKLQLVADVPTWIGAYEKAQAAGEDEKTSIALADQAVRDSQGAGQIGDLAQIQRGNAWFKLWTNFYSFFSVGYNQMAESIAQTRRVGPARLPLLASDFLLVAVLPAVLGELLKRAVRGDDEDWEELPKELAKAELSYLLGFMVGLRELGAIVQNDGKGVPGPAGLRLLTSDLPKLYQQLEQGEADDALRKAAINAAGVLLHFPAAQVNRTVDGFEALAKGETKNPMAVLVGPPRKAK